MFRSKKSKTEKSDEYRRISLKYGRPYKDNRNANSTRSSKTFSESMFSLKDRQERQRLLKEMNPVKRFFYTCFY